MKMKEKKAKITSAFVSNIGGELVETSPYFWYQGWNTLRAWSAEKDTHIRSDHWFSSVEQAWS